VKAVDLDTQRVALRAVVADDLPDLARIRSTVEVARWWQARTAEELQYEWVRGMDEGEAHWTVWIDGHRAGFVQAYEEPDPDYRHAGLDLYLDPSVHGQHYGREIVERVVRHLLHDVGHHRVIIDPTLANEPAVRCYEAVGFKRVGAMRQYWFDHVEQCWADGLLMDIVVDDLLPFDLS
jgi:aminoglycoside 6'-N-acetyltransferase